MRLKDVLAHELIGLKARVIGGSHPGFHGLEGVIVDETQKIIVLRTPKGDKKLPKDCILLLIELPDGTKVEVDGKYLVGRPEDRIRRRRGW